MFTNRKPTIQVGAAVIEEQGRFLITQRGSEAHLAGYWEFPGGKREEGESLVDCVQREVHEELGIVISPPIPLKVLRHEYANTFVELHFFRCSIAHGEPRSLGCDDWRWVTPDELSAYQFPPADEPVVADLQRRNHSSS